MKQKIVLVETAAFWSELYNYVMPAVVQIFSQVVPFNWMEPYRIQEPYDALGTGFLISAQGYIITAAHVVSNAKEIRMYMPLLSGKQSLRLDLISICPERDIALLKVQSEDLSLLNPYLGQIPELEFANSDHVRSMDTVLVLGYQLGNGQAKGTMGIVSGIDTINNISAFHITAPINPGSSGGPVFDVHGQIIGITFGAIPTAQNVGYVLPINELSLIFDELNKNVLVRKSHVGARLVASSDELATYLDNPTPAGMYVGEVFDNMLFHKAGVKKGDMLYEFQGKRIDSFGRVLNPEYKTHLMLYDLISRLTTGDEVSIAVYRNGQRMDLKTINEGALVLPIRQKYPEVEQIEHDMLAGMVLMELTESHILELGIFNPQLFYYAQVENRYNPVLIVSSVIAGSYADYKSTVIPGDIIKKVNGNNVASLSDFKESLKKIKKGLISIETDRDVLLVFDVKKLIEADQKLQKNAGCPVSPAFTIVQKLL